MIVNKRHRANISTDATRTRFIDRLAATHRGTLVHMAATAGDTLVTTHTRHHTQQSASA